MVWLTSTTTILGLPEGSAAARAVILVACGMVLVTYNSPD